MEEIFYFNNHKFIIINNEIYQCISFTNGNTSVYQRIKLNKKDNDELMESYVLHKLETLSIN